jgi:rhamnosyltransferase
MMETASPRSGAAPRVVAVVVTYEPEPVVLRDVLDALCSQVEAVVLVENGCDSEADSLLEEVVGAATHRISLERNIGIAAAQNLGIEWACAEGAEYVLLSDQDSRPEPEMVAHLVAASDDLLACGTRLALVAPDFVDERQAVQIPFMHLVDERPCWFGCERTDARPKITTAIASGALIPVATLEDVGSMRASLFIDLVDIEWCFRAHAYGFQAFGVCRAKLRHCLGDEPTRVFGRTLATHSPLRNYYFYRNALWLFRQSYVPNKWKWAVGLQMLKRFLVFSLFVSPRLQYLRMMTLGIWHGLSGRSGAL